MAEREVGAPSTTKGHTTNTNTHHDQEAGENYITTYSVPNGAGGQDFSFRAQEMRRYFEAVFGSGFGYVHVGVGYGGNFETGRYDFERWVPESFCWPARDLDANIARLLKKSEQADVYVCPYLMMEDRRAKGIAAEHRLVHSDIDREPFDSVKAEKLNSIGGFAIESGSPKHVHAYVPLSESVSMEQHEALCVGLGNYLGGADSKISDNDVLRPPGTFNHKPRVRDRKPIVPVRWFS